MMVAQTKRSAMEVGEGERLKIQGGGPSDGLDLVMGWKQGSNKRKSPG